MLFSIFSVNHIFSHIYMFTYCYAANPVQHEIYFSIECIWELVETNILKMTFILM